MVVTAADYFAATFLEQNLKLNIPCESLLIMLQCFFGVPPYGTASPGRITPLCIVAFPLPQKNSMRAGLMPITNPEREKAFKKPLGDSGGFARTSHTWEQSQEGYALAFAGLEARKRREVLRSHRRARASGQKGKVDNGRYG